MIIISKIIIHFFEKIGLNGGISRRRDSKNFELLVKVKDNFIN